MFFVRIIDHVRKYFVQKPYTFISDRGCFFFCISNNGIFLVDV